MITTFAGGSSFLGLAAVFLAFGLPPEPIVPSPTDTCSFSPSGTVSIDIDEVKTFTPSSLECSGLTATISPADGSAGFSSGTACTKTSVTITTLIKVRGCDFGSPTLTIRDGGIVVQTIDLLIGFED